MKEKKKNRCIGLKYLGYDFVRFNGWPGLIFFRPKKIYISQAAKKPIKGGAILVSNHISLVDPMYLMITFWKRRHHFVAMKDLFEGRFNNWLFTKVFLALKIDRDNMSIGAFKDIINHLKNDDLVSIFPEGHVNVDEKGVKTFKSGMVMMALQSKKPIIPVYIKRRKHWYSRLKVAVGEPIDVFNFKGGKPLTIKDIEEVTQYIEEQEKKLEEFVERK